MNYKEPYMAIGIIGGWGMLLLGLSYYARERIGINRWKALHRLTAVAWILGVIHTLGEGTDAGQPWFLALTVAAVAPVALLLAARILTTRRPLRERFPSPARASAAAACKHRGRSRGSALAVRRGA